MLHPALRLTREVIRRTTLRQILSGASVRLLLIAGIFLLVTTPAFAVTKTSNVASTGNWNTAGSWSPSGVPAAGDDVIIAAGDTINLNVNTAAIASLTINGTLALGDNTARTITVTGAVTIASGGTITINNFNDTHIFNIGGNLANSGVFDMNTGADDLCNVTFNGSANQTVSGAGATTQFNLITINNSGAAGSNIVEITSTNFTTPNNFLTLTDGTFKLSTGATLTLTGANLSLTAPDGFIINHASAVVDIGNQDVLVSGGSFQLLAGTLNVGTGNDLFSVSSGTVTLSGGTLNVFGQFQMSGGTTTINGATINLDPNATAALGNASHIFEAQGAANLTFSSGSVVIVDPHSATGTGNAVQLTAGAGTKNLAGSTIQLGNGVSTTTGSTDGFDINAGVSIGNLVVNNPSGTNRHTRLITSNCTLSGNFTITAGTFQANNLGLTIAGNFTNNGTFTPGTQTTTFNGAAAQTIGGSASTTFSSLTINNTAGTQPGVTLGIDTTVGGTMTLTTDLNASGGILTHTGGATACSGNGDLVGIVKRTTIAVGTTYCFGNSLNTIQFNSGTPTSPTMTVTLVKGSLPGNIANAVNRLYTLEPTGMTAFSATVQLRYLDGELNGILEGTLKLWRDSGNGNWVNVGGTVNVGSNFVNVSGVTAFSPWVFANGTSAPTAVRMRGVQTVATADGVELRWRTGHEVDNLGFRIYREENGQRTLITKNVIAGSSLAVGRRATLTTGRSYRWTDEDGSANAAYWLEDIDLNGVHTLHGPFTPFPGAGASNPNKGGKKANRSAPNANTSQNSMTLEMMSRQAAQEIRATHEVTPLGATPGSYLGTAVRNAKVGEPKDSAESSVRMLGGERAVKLAIKQEGWYRVTQPELLAAGLDPQANPRNLKLYVDGREVPITVTGAEDGRFDPADSVEFYGMGLDTTVTDTRVYWLLSDKGAGARVRKLAQVNGTPAGSGYMQTVERRDRETYMATLLNGAAENFFGAIVTPTDALDQTLLAPSVDRSAPANATLEIALQGVTTVPHMTSVIFNGTPLGSVSFNGQGQGVQRFTVPQTQVLDGVNTVTLQNTGDASDYSLVSYVRLTYPRAYQADNDALTLNAQAFQRVTINGFTDKGIRVFDVTDERNVVELETVIKQEAVGFSVTTTPQGTGQRRLVALSPSRLLLPAGIKANIPSRWLTKGNRADLLLVTHNTLAAQFSPLATLRRSQGLRVEVVDIEDVYDEISFGHKTATGLNEFLAFTATFWNSKPKYVLLAGDASYDPRNYTNNGDSDLVPTRLVDAGTLETASDDALVDFDGDGLPDLTVGRLPARTPAEAQRMVERLLNYDKATLTKETVLVADQNIGYNFESLISNLQTQVPIGQTTTTILRSQDNDSTTRANLVTALNRGPRLVNYFGHGSFDLWNGDILTVADAAGLQNGNKHSVYVMMTCLTGYFLEPGADSLAETLLKNLNGGAVAVWAGTGYTEPDPQEVINKSVFPNLFTPGQLLGDALRQAKSATTDRDTRLTWIFFGDPTMRLR